MYRLAHHDCFINSLPQGQCGLMQPVNLYVHSQATLDAPSAPEGVSALSRNSGAVWRLRNSLTGSLGDGQPAAGLEPAGAWWACEQRWIM